MEQKNDSDGVFISGREVQVASGSRWSQTGFPDPDRGSPKHDLACQYLSQPRIASKLLVHVVEISGRKVESVENCMVATEFHVQRVAYRSISTVGFADIVVASIVKIVNEEYKARPALLVEIKTTQTPVGDILRQMKTYHDFICRGSGYGIGVNCDDLLMVLATTYDLTVKEVEWLKREDVTHVRLAASFDNFCRTAQATKASSAEI